MKKSLLLMAAAVAMTASAQEFTVANNFMDLGYKKYTESNEVVASAKKQAKKVAVKADEEIAGDYIFVSLDDNACNTSGAVTIATSNDGYTINGLAPAASIPVNATYANGVLTVAPGQVCVNHKTYGEGKLYVMTDASHYNTQLAAKLEVDEDGTIYLTNAVGFIVMLSGAYDGYNLGAATNDFYELDPVNGMMTSNYVNTDWTPASPAVKEFPSATFFMETENGVVGGLAGIDGITWNTFVVAEDGKVTFSNSDLYNYSETYNNAVMRMGGNTSTGAFGVTSSNAEGTVDFEKGELTIGPWCFCMTQVADTTKIGILNGRKSGSVVTFPVPEDPTGINDINVVKATKAVKFVENGQVVILKDGVKYNIAGQTIK